ncbi:MAG TPA: hypothetical protein PKK12_06885 [Candidatus Aminicenantes bacterium]|nr:hypothetical protein [Candidatus Aminicenantes bacterium]
MADIGKVSGKSATTFPVKRRSADPLQPESPEIQFSQELIHRDNHVAETVQAAELAESTRVRDDRDRRQLRKRGEKRERSEEGEEDEAAEEPIVDLEV